MRFLHTSDWHLGRSLFGCSLLDDQEFALKSILAALDERKPDGLLIAGDVFDRSVPPEDAVELLDWFLHEAVTVRQTPTFMIPGNHDSPERVGFGSRLLRDGGLCIFSRIEDAWNGQVVERRADSPSGVRAERAVVYGIPYFEPAFFGEALGDPELRTHDSAMRAACARVRQAHERNAGGLPSVVLAHAFVAGGEESADSERPLAVGGSSFVDPSAFDGFSYVALGHLHKPQKAGAERIRYSGSLLPYSKSEAAHAKGALIVEIDREGRASAEEIPVPALRKLRAIEGELSVLLAAAERESTEDRDAYVVANLLDRGPAYDAFGKLRAFYPRLLHVGRQPPREPDAPPGATGAPPASRARERSVLELFEDFFLEAAGAPLNEDERRILREVAAQEGLS